MAARRIALTEAEAVGAQGAPPVAEQGHHAGEQPVVAEERWPQHDRCAPAFIGERDGADAGRGSAEVGRRCHGWHSVAVARDRAAPRGRRDLFIDDGDEVDFARTLPVLHAKGFRARNVSFYRALRTITGDRNRYIVTSKADGRLARNGFDKDRIFTPHGDRALVQCRRARTQAMWPSRPPIKRAITAINLDTYMIANPNANPAGPRSGGSSFINVRAGAFFIMAPHETQANCFGA
jgi:hypothetical protein